MEWLNYHHLRYFWTVAKEGGLRQAAEKLHVSPPSISAQIRTRGETKKALSVPHAAVVRVDGEATVFVEVGEGRVEVRKVELGASTGELQEVVSGLEPGERVATAGVFALKSELFR